jgi:hypothetical protein
MYQGSTLESMSWYKDLLELAKKEVGSLKEVIKKIPESILEMLDRRNLFEIIKRNYNDEFHADGTFYPEQIASDILYRIALLVEDDLLNEYDSILDKSDGNSRRRFVPDLRREKLKQKRIKDFFDKHFPE